MDLLDHRGSPIRLLESPGDPRRVAVFYPGLNYGPLAPLFFYLDKALEQAGWTVLAIDYRYSENPEFRAVSDADKDAWFLADSLAIGRWVADRTQGCQVAHLAKSLGTTMLLNQAKAGLVALEASLVWMTPGTTAGEQFAWIRQASHRCLVAYGTADQHALRVSDWTLNRPGVTVLEVPNAGHSFEVAGEVRQSLLNVADVVDAVAAFLREGAP